MPRRIIEIVEPDPLWPALFQEEARAILSVIPNGIVAVHHIGSTSVAGLAAKPVIDILLEVEEVAVLDSHKAAMEGLGYIAKGEFGIPGRRFYLKGLVQRTHHVHAFRAGSHDVVRHLAVRDYLRAHPEVSKEYGLLKKRCAEEFRHDNEGYCDAKSGFVEMLERDALRWCAR